MALKLIDNEVTWVQQVKGKKHYEWRVWSEKDQYLELYFEPSDETNHAVLPEPFTGDHHSSHYYICANPPTHEERTKEYLEYLFAEDADYQKSLIGRETHC
jgi:hypothetical protein